MTKQQTKLSDIEKRLDLRGIIVRHTSEMLENPDRLGIYPTTKFYTNLEDEIRQEIKDLVKEIVKEMRMEERLTRKKNPTEIEIGLVLGFNSAKNIQNQKLDKILKRWGVKK